jgi:hypothetical protein
VIVPINGDDQETLQFIDHGVMACIVVGGVANGLLIQQMKSDAERVQLGQPSHVKPLESANQDKPEIAKDVDVYNVFKMYLPLEGNRVVPFGLAIIDGQTPAWAMSNITIGFVKQAAEELLSENFIK